MAKLLKLKVSKDSKDAGFSGVLHRMPGLIMITMKPVIVLSFIFRRRSIVLKE